MIRLVPVDDNDNIISLSVDREILYTNTHNIIHITMYTTKRKCRNRFGKTAFVTNRNWPPFAFQYVSTIRAERLSWNFLIQRGKMNLSYFVFLVPAHNSPPPYRISIEECRHAKSVVLLVLKSNSNRTYKTPADLLIHRQWQ